MNKCVRSSYIYVCVYVYYYAYVTELLLSSLPYACVASENHLKNVCVLNTGFLIVSIYTCHILGQPPYMA